MAGIKHLADIYQQKGKEFIDKLFDNFVTINEKLDGSAFSIEKSPLNKIEYFKRNNSSPISLIDRTLMRFYESAISYFDQVDPSVIEKIPKGWRFGFEYMLSDTPQEITYSRVPKNNLVLSYIHVKNNHLSYHLYNQ